MASKVFLINTDLKPEDALAILIEDDPDAVTSAPALSRIFRRKAKKAAIFRINTIDRPDNPALIRFRNAGLGEMPENRRTGAKLNS